MIVYVGQPNVGHCKSAILYCKLYCKINPVYWNVNKSTWAMSPI